MFDTLSEKFGKAFQLLSPKGHLRRSQMEGACREIRKALLEADVEFELVETLVGEVLQKALGQRPLAKLGPREQFIKIVHDELTQIMGGASGPMDWGLGAPVPQGVLVVGLNGQGKTTFSAKLALFLREKHKKKVLLVPADTTRPGAKEQLQALGARAQVPVYDSNLRWAPKKIVQKARRQAQALGAQVMVVDVAGRLEVDDQLMGELQELRKQEKEARALLVTDAMYGQRARAQAQSFHEAIGLGGVVLSKMDTDSRAGAANSIKVGTGVPIVFLSTGERVEDLEVFHPDRLAGRMLGMGDVATLVERARAVVGQEELALPKGGLTYEDLAKQMGILSKMGPASSLLKMLPGMQKVMKGAQGEDIQGGLEKIKAMVSSMTVAERRGVHPLCGGRMSRIAKGSGNSLAKVQEFVKHFQSIKALVGPRRASRPKRKGPWGESFF